MAEPPEPEVFPRPGRRRRRLDGRTVAIAVTIALIAAVASYLLANAMAGRGSSGGESSRSPADPRLTLSPAKVDGEKLLAAKVVMLDGRNVAMGDLVRTKVTLVNFWQANCTPCIKEMPLLEQLHQRDRRVDVIGVDTQDRIGPAKTMAARTVITYPWVQDRPGDVFYAANAVALPTSVLISPSGKVLAAKTGQFHSLAEIRSWLDDHLT